MAISRIISLWNDSCLLCAHHFFLIYKPYIKFLASTNQQNFVSIFGSETATNHILFARRTSSPKSSIPVRQLREEQHNEGPQHRNRKRVGKDPKSTSSSSSNANKEESGEDNENKDWTNSDKKLQLGRIKFYRQMFGGSSSDGKQGEDQNYESNKKNKKRKEENIDDLLKERQEKLLADVERQFSKGAADHMRKVFDDIEKSRKGQRLPYSIFIYAFGVAAIICIFVLYVLYKIMNYFSSDTVKIDSEQMYVPVKITWTEFLNQIVKSGQVSKVLIGRLNFWEKLYLNSTETSSAGTQTITIFMNKLAKDGKGHMFNPVYTVDIPTTRLSRIESQIREAEIAAGLPPQHWANIIWMERNTLSFFIKEVIGMLLFLMFLRITMKSAGGMSMNMSSMVSSMMGHRIRIMDPSSRAGRKGLSIRFRDVAGMHEAKVEVSEFVDYLRRPQKYTRLGARLPKGALLTGPPGCGKTLLAKALAAESSVPFINVNGTEFVELIGGLGASRVRQLFVEAKSRAPCIIYIDEIDAIGRKRQEDVNFAGGDNSEMEQTLNQLLVEMDGMNTAKGIVVIASTNRPDILDKALLRPGRFDRHVSIDLPTVSERKEMFDLYLRKIKKENQLTNVSQRLAQMTPGFSGADINNVVNESAIHAATNQKKMVTLEDVHYALDKIMAGPEKRTKTLVDEERQIVAFHESGHALVGWMLEHTEALLKVTIIPRTSAALGFAQYSPKDRKLFTKEELFDRMCMMLGGRAAENLTFGRITTGAQNDLEKVTKQAQAMVKWYGMSDQLGPISFLPAAGTDPRSADFREKPYSKKLGNLIDQEISRLVSKAYFTTESLLSENKDKLEKLATTLLTRETLSYEEVKKLIGPPKFGDKNVVDLPEDVLPEPPKT